MAQSTRPPRRLEFLDAARGIAALAVAVYHTASGAGPFAFHWLFEWQNIGVFAVMAFFLVSGFIIPVSLQRHSLGKFWIARIFRLGPAYWFTILLLLALGWAGLFSLDPAFWRLHPVADIANLLMVAPLLHQPTLVGVSWTLGIELIFYMLCSGIKAAGLLERRLATAYAAIAAYLLWFVFAATHVINPLHFKAAWGGFILAAFVGSVFYQVQAGTLAVRQLYPLLAVFLITTIAGLRFEAAVPHTGPVGVTVPFLAGVRGWCLAVAVFCVLFALRRCHFPAPLLWLGRVSYSLYLMHDVVILVLQNRMQQLNPYLKSCVLLVISLLAAELCFRLIEQPSLRLSRGAHRNQPVPV